MDPRAPQYLQEFMDQIQMLPAHIRGKFAKMREMEDHSVKLMKEAEKASDEAVLKSNSKTTAASLDKAYRKVFSLQGEAISDNHAKLAVAELALAEVDQTIRKLDEKLRGFETQLRKEDRWPVPAEERPRRRPVLKEGNVVKQPRSTRRSAGVAQTEPLASDKVNRGEENESEAHLTVVEDMSVDPNEPRYCYCHRVAFGEMVMCEHDNCPHTWFHFTCVGLSEAPTGQWYCPECPKKAGD